MHENVYGATARQRSVALPQSANVAPSSGPPRSRVERHLRGKLLGARILPPLGDACGDACGGAQCSAIWLERLQDHLGARTEDHDHDDPAGDCRDERGKARRARHIDGSREVDRGLAPSRRARCWRGRGQTATTARTQCAEWRRLAATATCRSGTGRHPGGSACWGRPEQPTMALPVTEDVEHEAGSPATSPNHPTFAVGRPAHPPKVQWSRPMPSGFVYRPVTPFDIGAGRAFTRPPRGFAATHRA
jgi:hypothetical protein